MLEVLCKPIEVLRAWKENCNRFAQTTDTVYLNANEADSLGDPTRSIPLLILQDVLPAGTDCYGASALPEKDQSDFATTMAADFFARTRLRRRIFQSGG